MCLNKILQTFGCKRPFKQDGGLSAAGGKAYSKLVKIIENLPAVSLVNIDTHSIIKELDRLSSQGVFE